ncbi:ferrochelatase [Sulfurospirillum arcachonense]|uniref:ferrochelatase n=1 Tax=Sulfurospirillum arcachonense TaxID=57666 RepID=UPI000468990F|nr:ferrochelatase [Sulfurospirillum arcachonense]
MKKALVLLNMGGPHNLDEVEVFLKNMFNDKNIITLKSDLLRSFIAFMIVASRKKEARSNYATLGGKSPIVGYTEQLVQKLQLEFDDTYVTYAMRYTPPFSKEVVEELKQKGIQEAFLLPLYPQYSTTTTKSSLEDFEEALEGTNIQIKTLNRFYENTLYNELLVDKIEEALKEKDSKEFELIFSAHSLPQKIVNAGDSYQKEILLHVELLKDILKQRNLIFKDIHVAYQSKLGPIKWLEPSLENKLKSLTCKKVLISPLSFTIDNSETEFELSIEYKEVADTLDYDEYLVAKCPNDSQKFIEVISEIIR